MTDKQFDAFMEEMSRRCSIAIPLTPEAQRDLDRRTIPWVLPEGDKHAARRRLDELAAEFNAARSSVTVWSRIRRCGHRIASCVVRLVNALLRRSPNCDTK